MPMAAAMKETSQLPVVLVGRANVGKSALFYRLTGQYVTVSNYPGTTVEVVRELVARDGRQFNVVDTPGCSSLIPLSEDEVVTRRILMESPVQNVLHVVDAKNLAGSLPMTFELLEGGWPLLLVLNLMDEAKKAGLSPDLALLEKELGVPVAPTTAVTGAGAEVVLRFLPLQRRGGTFPFRYEARIEQSLQNLSGLLLGEYPLAVRGLALLLLQGDEDALAWMREKEGPRVAAIESEINGLKFLYNRPLSLVIAMARAQAARRLAGLVLKSPEGVGSPARKSWWGEALSRPLLGWPALAGLLLATYLLVGVFGAGVVVDFLEKNFNRFISPPATRLVTAWVPWTPLHSLIVGEFGIITLAVRYAAALVLPLVTLFFLVFAVIEDSGYLPRLSMLIDRLFKTMGLSGKAVIPMVLGFGCDTMATMTTRTLPTLRERVLATLLLSLAIPCSAQLGVMLALFAGVPGVFSWWAAVLCLVFLAVGWLGARVIPGKTAVFYLEIPPLRRPRLSNVLVKTYHRVRWYWKEVFPLFVFASIMLWTGQQTGLFELSLKALVFPARWLGLPDGMARVFLFGFFRRDYGSAGLYDMVKAHLLTRPQLLVASVTLTLFLPCIAQFLITMKERGTRMGLAVNATVVVLAFGIGFLLQGAAPWLLK